MEHPVIRNAKAAGKEQGWIESTEPLVAAVSGGGDSVALFFVLRELYRGPIFVAHLDHGIRTVSSRKDAEFVLQLCKENGIDCFLRNASIPRQKERGESLEVAARRIRYEFLEEVRRKVRADWIAVGHNADDTVETILLNLLRGTGLAGLCGLPGRRDSIIRPLIHSTRCELRRFLRERGIPWREDETNLDSHYLRNRLRNELIPLLERDYNPAVARRLLSMRETLIPCRENLEERGRNAAAFLRRELPSVFSSWDLSAIRRLEPSSLAEVFRSEAKRLGLKTLDFDRIATLTELIRSSQGWRFQWEKSLEIRAGSGYLALLDREIFDRPPDEPLVLEEPSGTVRWGLGTFSWEPAEKGKLGFSDFSAILPSLPEKPVIRSSIAAAGYREIETMPWFYRKGWPTVTIGDRMSWTPFWGNLCKISGKETNSPRIRIQFSPDAAQES
ncbi:MAG: tRNA lysidine(34) synthetase TilS [Synergistaceae bacterium]|nr:tRNA lysidine(34) synthetase TilS [Synergistaceae bacterium]